MQVALTFGGIDSDEQVLSQGVTEIEEEMERKNLAAYASALGGESDAATACSDGEGGGGSGERERPKRRRGGGRLRSIYE